MRNFFPAKILLFGEHRVLRGAKALAVPFPRSGARWSAGEPDPRLLNFVTYLEERFSAEELQLVTLRKDIESGQRLDSNVPQGYGMGSSGTVCAAIWERYGKPRRPEWPTDTLRDFLARMEGYFHGNSSGTDPLVSALAVPLEISEEGVRTVELPPGWQPRFFLIDTGQSRSSAPLINRFLQRYDEQSDFRKGVDQRWGPADDQCREALYRGDYSALTDGMQRISTAQMELISDFITERMRPVWRGQTYCCKICGAGGGGYVLGYSWNWSATRKELSGLKYLQF